MKNYNFKNLFKKSKLQSIKLTSYFDIYESLFSEFKKKPITFVEVGIFGGGSLFMWKKYFHPKSRIIGIDLNPKSKNYEKYGFEIFIGDQEDENFWKNFYKKVGKIDILLDDGGHTDIQQTQTLISSINNIKENGIIAIEDVHTSYLTEFGNPSSSSFINYSKKIVDLINYRYSGLNKLKYRKNKITDLFKKNVYSVNFFESVVAFRINKKKSIISKAIWNKKKVKRIQDFRYKNNKNSLWGIAIYTKDLLPKSLSNFFLIKTLSKSVIKYFINRKKNKKLRRFNI
jgi:hypothetical protein